MADLAPTSPSPHHLDGLATRLFALAIAEQWAGFLLYHLFDGGGVTLDAATRRPILIAGAEMNQLIQNGRDDVG